MERERTAVKRGERYRVLRMPERADVISLRMAALLFAVAHSVIYGSKRLSFRVLMFCSFVFP